MYRAVLVPACLAFGGGEAMIPPGASAGQSFTLTVENEWYLGWASGIALSGITHDEGEDRIWIVSSTTDKLYRVSPSDPLVVEETIDVPGDWGSGIAARGYGAERYIYLVDGNIQGSYYAYHDGSWIFYSGNPASEYGTGLDVEDNGMLWESVHDYGLMRFYPGSSTFTGFEYHTPGATGSGVTLFPWEDGTGVAVSLQNYNKLEFFVFEPPDSLVFLGDADIPVSVDFCSGLEYVSSRATFYLTVRISGLMHMLEVGCDVLELRQDTWGSIKTAM
ncbi:MAG: hypothetical protein AVO35_05745 [Candidatus Aegiribacteria sp. MLS_C]|nr:MAG: hypothetical protein AVO35_05745 [Candidatus Aegiribacteria sp. MLS_C]